MKKYIDRKILETLITKYGINGVKNAINESENEFEYQATLCSDWFGSCNNCKLINNQSTMDRWMGKKINDILKTGEVIDDGFSKTAAGPRPDRYEVYEVPKDGQYFKYESIIIKYSKGNDIGNYYYIPNYVYDILEREFNRSSKTHIVNEMAYKYDYNRLSDCPLTYNTQLDFKKYFIKRSTQEGYKFNKNVFYFDNIDCVDTKTSRDIPGVKANKTLNFDEAYNRLLKYFLNNSQEQVNESGDVIDFTTNWGKQNEDDKEYYVRDKNNKDEIFDAAVLLFFVKGSKNEIYWRDVNAEYEYGDEYYDLIYYVCRCLGISISKNNNINIVKQAYRGINALASLFNYNFNRLQKFAENNKEINKTGFHMRYFYADKAYDVLLNAFGDI